MRPAASTVNVADLETVPDFAVIVAVVVCATETVLTVKVIEVFPVGIDTFAGTFTNAELDDSAKLNPPAGAEPVRVRVPCAGTPPATEIGETTRELKTAG